MRTCTRQEAIDDLRAALVEASGDERSVCQVAKDKGLFCHGWAQWKLHELKAMYPQIVRSRPHITRERMEELADRWQMARQFVTDCETACDLQLQEDKFQTCKGWDEFDDQAIARFHLEICDEEVQIVPAGEPSRD